MVAKKKVTKAPIKPQEDPVSLEEAVVKEERKPAVTQVVEVIADETPSTSLEAASPEPMEEKAPMEEAAPVEDPQPATQPAQDVEEKNADEKRKELVDELFQKKAPTPTPIAPEISMHTKRKTNPIFLWAIGMIVTCLVVGAGIVLFSGKAGSFPSIVVIPTPTATPTPQTTPTPTPEEVKRESLTIQVLNGGGVAGAATKMKNALEDKGYTVADTANAASYTYTKTEIRVKSSKKAYITLLEEDLKGSYTLGSSSATLEDDSSYDAQVIVGKE